jgi:hypothetical protein
MTVSTLQEIDKLAARIRAENKRIGYTKTSVLQRIGCALHTGTLLKQVRKLVGAKEWPRYVDEHLGQLGASRVSVLLRIAAKPASVDPTTPAGLAKATELFTYAN